jgi:hypothetical protein
MNDKGISPVHGQCLCGAVKYEVDAIGPRMAHCHCSMCRKFHGAAFATFGEARAEDFRWLEGEHLLSSYQWHGTPLLFPLRLQYDLCAGR